MAEKKNYRETILQTCYPELDAPFSIQEFKDRLDRVRQRMAREKIDLLYLSAPESIYYLSGYQAAWYASNGNKDWLPMSGIAVHADHDKFILIEGSDELILARNTSVATDIRLLDRTKADEVVSILKGEGWLGKTVGLEMWCYRPNRAVSDQFQKQLENEGCTVVDGTDIVREIRAIKSSQELSYIETAARIADIGMQAAIDHAKPGLTEIEVHAEVFYAMAKAGGELNAIPGLVNSGSRTCSHGLTSRRHLMPGDILVLDICGVYNRYHANVSRTLSMGQPSPAVAKQIDLSAKSVDVLKSTVRPNLPVAELNKVMKDYYVKAGIWEDRWWVGGYEFGIAFAPDWVGSFWYDPDYDPGDRVFRPGEVVNFESMFYLPENAGVSWLINTIMYKENEARLLSNITSELIVIE